MLSPDSCETIVIDLKERRNVYNEVLKAAEGEGNGAKSRRYKRIIKQYDDAIKAYSNGKCVPLDELPNPPGLPPLVSQSGSRSPSLAPSSPNLSNRVTPASSNQPSPSLERREITNDPVIVESEPTKPASDITVEVTNEHSQTVPLELLQQEEPEDVSNPVKLLAALTSRLEVYFSVQTAAEDEGNSSKSRRYKRITKQYQDAITSLKSGKNIALEELPNPPGFKPLVVLPKSAPPSPQPDRKAVSTRPAPPPVKPQVSPKTVISRAEKQSLMLKERQQEYKEAALNAKKLGQMNEAKEFLRLYKGFDKLIQASEGGFPVDMMSIPVSLKDKIQVNDESFHMVTEADFIENSQSDIYEKLEAEIKEQIKHCLQFKNNFMYNGDIANANRFETYALNFKKDFNRVKASQQRGDDIPKFHYEIKKFTIIQCFNDLTDNELELTIVQGINYNVPNPEDVDTYVKYEFPYPSDNPPKGRTELIKNTNNPQYNATFKLAVNRDSKVCQRLFKRQTCSIKLEVMSRGGFLRSDATIGIVSIKLTSLTTDLMIHDAFDIISGRKAVGKLEVKIRVREPLSSKKIEQVQEKWVILD